MKGTVMPTPTFVPRLVGETEKTLNAILDRHLSPYGLTEQHWLTLSFAAMSGDPRCVSELAREVASRAKFTEDDVRARIFELVDAQLLSDCGSSGVSISDAGERLHARILDANIDVTKRLWGDLPAEDLATTARVLATVLERGDAELARD
jgi:DNA-binding MarR family transcriptional regulator